ncbi:MAG: rod shape-determining protein MreD [Parvibaculales bacterium]
MAFKSGSGLRNFLQSQREPSGLSQAIPFLVVAVLLMLQHAPLPGIQGVSAMPSLSIIAIFFWAVSGEDRLSYTSSFGLGLFKDLLTGTPLGLWGTTLLVMHMYTASQSSVLASASFVTNWISFSIVALACYVFVYFGVAWHVGETYAFGLVLPPFITTLMVFPVMTRLLDFIEQRLSLLGVGS